HLEPDVLIVDEALSVGDAAFQKKCLGRMNALAAAEGRTVVFVSHNTKAVLDLCSEAIWLERGRVAAHGRPREVLARYLGDRASPSEWRPKRDFASAAFSYDRVAIGGGDGGSPQYDEALSIELDYFVATGLPPNRLSILISNGEGAVAFCSADT